MTFLSAVANFFSSYYVFEGRARRSEFWYSTLFWFVSIILLRIVDFVAFGSHAALFAPLWLLVTFLPMIAVSVRRLHDIDRQEWWFLLALVPIVGWLILFVGFCSPGTDGPNRFGDAPA